MDKEDDTDGSSRSPVHAEGSVVADSPVDTGSCTDEDEADKQLLQEVSALGTLAMQLKMAKRQVAEGRLARGEESMMREVFHEMQQTLCDLAPKLVAARKAAEKAVHAAGASLDKASEIPHVVGLVQQDDRIERMQAWLTKQLEQVEQEELISRLSLASVPSAAAAPPLPLAEEASAVGFVGG